MLRRALLAFVAVLLGAFALLVALNPWTDHNPATAQIVARYAIAVVAFLGAVYLMIVAWFSSDEYLRKHVTLDKFLDRR